MRRKLTFFLLIIALVFLSIYVYSNNKKLATLEAYVSEGLWFEFRSLNECLVDNRSEIKHLIENGVIYEVDLQDMSKCFLTISNSMSTIEKTSQRIKNFPKDNNPSGTELSPIAKELSAHINKSYLGLPIGGFNDLLSYEDADKMQSIEFDQKELEKFEKILFFLDGMIEIFDKEIQTLDDNKINDFINEDGFKSFYQAYQSYMGELPPGYLNQFLYD